MIGVPTYLGEAFHDAVDKFAYGAWSPARPHQLFVSLMGEPHSMSTVCRLMAGLDRRLPEAVFSALWRNMRAEDKALKEQIVANPSYANSARCLLKLMKDRVAEYQTLSAWDDCDNPRKYNGLGTCPRPKWETHSHSR